MIFPVSLLPSIFVFPYILTLSFIDPKCQIPGKTAEKYRLSLDMMVVI